ncbi:hypothetical protein AHAS_Ahas10G0135900 [Arachis hypogaea]
MCSLLSSNHVISSTSYPHRFLVHQPLQNISFLNYIGEKVIPDEKLPWVQGVLRKCFTGDV